MVPTECRSIFFTVHEYAGKTDLSMGYMNTEGKLGAAGHFLEIIKQLLFYEAVKYKVKLYAKF